MEFVEFQRYALVDAFVTNHLVMQLDDVAAMLRLPLPEVGIRAGCNFAAAATLCNLISGISTVLYKPRTKMRSGLRFKELLKKYFPWEPTEDKEENAKVIYDIFRNPLAHSLGRQTKTSLPVLIAKNRSEKDRIEELQQSTKRPESVPLAVRGDASKGYVLSVEGLYWGVIQMLRKLAEDTEQMHEANITLGFGSSIKSDA